MAPKPRDLLKTRAQRIGEVYTAVHEKTGQFDAQLVSFGCLLSVGTTTTQLAVGAGEYVVSGAVVSFAGTAAAGVAVPASVNTTAGQFRKVLVNADKNGAITFTPGAIVTTVITDAVLPRTPSAGLIDLGWIELSGLFTAATTALTAGMLKQMVWTAP